MKVVQVNSVCGVGSTGRICTDLHKILIENGHESVIAYGRNTAKDCDNVLKIGTNYSQIFHGIISRFLDLHGIGSYFATKKLVKQLKTANPDIIHLHNIHGYYLNFIVLFNYLKKSDVPVVWTLHDCWTFTGHCAYFDYVNCSKWKTICNKCPQKREYPKSYLVDMSSFNHNMKKKYFTSLNSIEIVSPSNWLIEKAESSFFKNYNMNLINNGVDTSVFKPLDSNILKDTNISINRDKFIILGVANVWERRKGLHIFDELANKLDDSFQIVIIGIDKKQSESIHKSIITIPRTETVEKLVELYNIADVFLNPTLEDNYPTTNIESLACGTPVISFNTGGSIECIERYNGNVISSNNVYEVLEILQKYKDDRFKQNNREFIIKDKNRYSTITSSMKYLELYEKIYLERRKEL